MTAPHDSRNHCRVALVLLEPEDLTVLWHNEHAATLLSALKSIDGILGNKFADLHPLTSALGFTAKLRKLVDDGEPVHVTTHVVGVQQGRSVRASAYKLPSGEILLVGEQR